MIKKYLLALFIASAAFKLQAQSIDQSKSQVSFEVDNMGIRSVEGLFTGIKGNITFNPTNLSNASFDVCIDASSINTENTKRDNHLKNEDFFQVDSFPTICFKSKSIVKSKEGYNVTGDLTMLGSTLEITFPFTYSSNSLKASFGLERLDFGLGIDYGSFMVGKTVEINISCYLK